MISHTGTPEPWRRLGAAVRRMPFGPLLGPVFAVAFLAGSLLPVLHSKGTVVGGLPDRPFDALAVFAVLLQCAPLAVWRKWPVWCLAVVAAGFALDQLRGYHSFAGSALPIALLGVAYRLERRRRATVLGFTLAYVPLAAALFVLGPEGPDEFVMFYLALVLAWGLGSWLRSTRLAEAERRRRVEADTRTAERARIARELHDVVTHHVTAMVVQAEAARYLTASPDRLDQALNAVTGTGRQAVTDLRHLLDLLNPDHGTDSGDRPTGRLRALVEQTRQAGQPVEFTEEGSPAESTGSADVVAYRIVQESLTNALKHARGSRTSVQVRHGEREITVEVGTDEATGVRENRAADLTGSGRGLAGLRERVDVLGGEFSAGPEAGGGFVVRARIPAGAAS